MKKKTKKHTTNLEYAVIIFTAIAFSIFGMILVNSNNIVGAFHETGFCDLGFQNRCDTKSDTSTCTSCLDNCAALVGGEQNVYYCTGDGKSLNSNCIKQSSGQNNCAAASSNPCVASGSTCKSQCGSTESSLVKSGCGASEVCCIQDPQKCASIGGSCKNQCSTGESQSGTRECTSGAICCVSTSATTGGCSSDSYSSGYCDVNYKNTCETSSCSDCGSCLSSCAQTCSAQGKYVNYCTASGGCACSDTNVCGGTTVTTAQVKSYDISGSKTIELSGKTSAKLLVSGGVYEITLDSVVQNQNKLTPYYNLKFNDEIIWTSYPAEVSQLTIASPAEYIKSQPIGGSVPLLIIWQLGVTYGSGSATDQIPATQNSWIFVAEYPSVKVGEGTTTAKLAEGTTSSVQTILLTTTPVTTKIVPV